MEGIRNDVFCVQQPHSNTNDLVEQEMRPLLIRDSGGLLSFYLRFIAEKKVHLLYFSHTDSVSKVYAMSTQI